MSKKEAINKALEKTNYIGSHRYQVFEQKLNEYGYKISPKKVNKH